MMRFQTNFRRTAWAGLALLATVAALSPPARAADEWPTRDITFYVPYAPGGLTDVVARLTGEDAAKMQKLLDALERIRKMPLPEDEMFGPCTLNVGTIQGGRAPNVIPDHALAEIFYRLVDDGAAIRAGRG